MRLFDPYALLLSLLVGGVGFGMTFYFNTGVDNWGMDEICYPALAMVYVYIRNARFWDASNEPKASPPDSQNTEAYPKAEKESGSTGDISAPRIDSPGVTAVKGTIPHAPTDGEVMVIFFWSTWCSKSKQYLPALLATATRFREEGVSFVGVSREGEEDVVSFVERSSRSFEATTLLVDAEGSLTKGYQGRHKVDTIPHCYIVRGVAGNGFGVVEWHGHPTRLEGVLGYLLDSSPNVDNQAEHEEEDSSDADVADIAKGADVDVSTS